MTTSSTSPQSSSLTPARQWQSRPESLTRVVIKIGSALITDRGQLSLPRIQHLVDDLVEIRNQGCEVVLVVSGAVAAGYSPLGYPSPPKDVVKRQAAASVGQPLLFEAWSRAFAAHGVSVAQLLLTAEDIENRRRYLSARHTLQLLLARQILPIINENDALSDDERKVGDNDHLATLVAVLSSAEHLILLSQVEGILRDGGKGARISQVDDAEPLHPHLHSGRSETGVGGMTAKISAARLAVEFGIPTVIADGRVAGLLPRLRRGEDLGTLFPAATPETTPRWIEFRSRTRGSLRISERAGQTLRNHREGLFPQDILEVEGDFLMGARVELRDPHDRPLGLGLVSYSSREIRLMMGKPTEAYEETLGFRYVDEVLQKNDFVPAPTTPRP